MRYLRIVISILLISAFSFLPLGNTSGHMTTEKQYFDSKQAKPNLKTADKANRYHPVVYYGYLLGGSNGSKWYQASSIVKYVAGGEKYKLYDNEKYIGNAKGEKGTPALTDEPSAEQVEINYKGFDTKPILAICGDWNALPRTPIKLNTSNPTYKRIISGVLKKEGLRDAAIRITSIFKVDLEGDGTNEVLISADNLADKDGWLGTDPKKNTYSLIILRKIINGKARNVILGKEIYKKGGESEEGIPYLHNVEGIYDANGDGVMEVVLNHEYYEGFYYELGVIKGTIFISLIGNGIQI